VEIGASTRLLTIVGDPVAHSLSPAMHNAAYRALGLNAVYVALRVPASAVSAVFQALAATGGAGNVTVPHKEAAERSVARKTDVCARAGACNTFWTEDGVLVGDNTDVAGVRGALAALGSNGRGGRWLVIGTGGSARAVAVAAADAGATLWVRSRHPDRARAFTTWASQIGVRAEATHGPVEVDTAINATPLGLGDRDPLPIEPKELRGVRTALDLVYTAGGTRWVRTLRERVKDVAASDGRDVLVQQGAAAFSRFFPGIAPPVEVMRAAVERALRA
jgi:shikimate dehydrogenase